MPKRLSIFCSCLPRKQRDNLSSRALYHDQDSSSGLDDYSGDDDDDYNYHDRYRNSPARLEALRPSLVADSAESTTPHNPWPSSFSNGRFSKQANHHRHPRQSSSLGSRGQRKPNPFRAEEPYRDDTSSEDDHVDGDEDGGSNRIRASSSSSRTRKSIFKPYRDDESDEDAEALREHQYMTTTSSSGQEVQDAPRIYPKMEYTPYRVETGVLTGGQAQNPRRMRTPRNPQGQHMASWQDDEDEDKRGQNSADAADAEEVIDVDALIAEQERITRELAAQEEALRKEEEDLIQKKKLAAIHAAEKRGLLRFEGGQLVIPSSRGDENNHTSNHVSSNAPHSGISEQQGPSMRQEGGDEIWNQSGRAQSLVIPMERTTSSSASSYVGGIDALDQELKLMSLDVKDHPKEKTTQSGLSTPTLIPTTRSPARPPVAVRTVSTGVSTSTSTFVVSPTLNINPRGVLNNITSFLKKVDGVIAGESSSDEASFSDQEQHLDKKKNSSNSNSSSHNSSNNQGTTEPAIAKMGSQGIASLHSSGSGQTTGGYSTSAAERDPQVARTVAVSVSVDPLEQQDSPHPTLTGDHSDDTIIYPTDVFNGPSETMSGRVSPTDSSLSTLGSRASSMKQRPMDDQEPGGVQPAAPPSPQPLSPTTATVTAAASERIFDTFTSFFNSGSSFMGLFGTGHRPEDNDARMHSDDEKHGRRLSSLKYGDPKKHRFDYRDHRLEDNDGPLAGDSWMGRKATPVANTTPSTAVHASHMDDDDGDSSSIDDYDF
ncbi:hypothetical protein BGZ67_000950 [Mortierella alpina]|nr:hypothetical protein BGZ67_000950 [Mortierella alpina]